MQRLDDLQQQGGLHGLDVQLARLLARLHPEMSAEATLAAAFASQALEEGHTCWPLTEIAALLQRHGLDGDWPDAAVLRRDLLASGAVIETGDAAYEAAHDPRPLVLDQANRLALWRWYWAEVHVAQNLRERASPVLEVDAARVRPLVQELFPAAPSEQNNLGPNLQKCAAALSLRTRLTILCGGPGTGKTYTLARMLALHKACAARPLRIALAAPTGRAAMRLGESIRAAAACLPASFDLHGAPEPQTLHRLLGFQPQSGAFLRNAANPLHVDLAVVDEASMVDVLLLEALLAALPATSRLILCGDPGQLPPVEPGSLLHALQTPPTPTYSAALRQYLQQACGETLPASPERMDEAKGAENLADCRISLQETHRFGAESGMLALAHALQEPETEAFLRTLAQPWPDIERHPGKESQVLPPALLFEHVFPLHRAATVQEAMTTFSRSRILCALREGPWGVAGINSRCKELLKRERLIPARGELYQGLPILILRNDYGQRLYNGDIGIIWPDGAGELKAWFEGEFGGEEGLRQLAPASLPPWQPAYAQTVHKAQGAEFATVLLLLPAEDNPLLSRELLYTAITRAKERLVLVAEQEQLHSMAARRLIRHSNLQALLREPAQAGAMGG